MRERGGRGSKTKIPGRGRVERILTTVNCFSVAAMP